MLVSVPFQDPFRFAWTMILQTDANLVMMSRSKVVLHSEGKILDWHYLLYFDCEKLNSHFIFFCLGTVIRRWGQLGKGVDGATDIHLAIFANNLHVANNQIISQIVSEEQKEQFQSFWIRHQHNELEGRNQLLASFCPQVYGLFLVKLAVR